MELWDAYDREENRLGFDLVRGETVPEGAYHLVCEVMVRHENGDYLLMKRDSHKEGFPGLYELTAGGSALKGEDAETCARRELFEETGIRDGALVEFAVEAHEGYRAIYHRYFLQTRCDPNAIVLQPGETEAFRWVDEAELERVLASGEAVPYTLHHFDRFRAYRREIPEALREGVRRFFAGDHSGHDWYHTVRVVNLALSLAEAEGADRGIVTLAALLHDVDDYKLTGGAMGATDNADRLMGMYGYSPEERERVCGIIRQVSFKGRDTVAPDSLEGKVVQDADRLDAIGAVGIARAFAFGGAHGRAMYAPGEAPGKDLSAEEYMSRKGSTINHFYEKLLLLRDMMNTESARRVADARHDYMAGFLDEFFAEWGGTR